ncbi:MAG: hypothetical protein RLZZ292_635 [Bacteroidota bacterium]|jgi:hypothetical protein
MFNFNAVKILVKSEFQKKKPFFLKIFFHTKIKLKSSLIKIFH